MAEAALASGSMTLPNGLEIAHLNTAETAVLFREIFTNRCWLPDEVDLSAGDVVVDVGANIGVASLCFDLEAEDLRIFAFEPAPAAFEALEKNLAGCRGTATATRLALGRERGNRTLLYYPSASVMSSLYADPVADGELTQAYLRNSGFSTSAAAKLAEGMHEGIEIQCEVWPLSAVIDEEGIARIDYLKIDVERSELDVLLGIRDEHWPLIRQVGAEVHDEHGMLAAIRELLERNGFHVVVRQDPLLRGTCVHDLFATR